MRISMFKLKEGTEPNNIIEYYLTCSGPFYEDEILSALYYIRHIDDDFIEHLVQVMKRLYDLAKIHEKYREKFDEIILSEKDNYPTSYHYQPYLFYSYNISNVLDIIDPERIEIRKKRRRKQNLIDKKKRNEEIAERKNLYSERKLPYSIIYFFKRKHYNRKEIELITGYSQQWISDVFSDNKLLKSDGIINRCSTIYNKKKKLQYFDNMGGYMNVRIEAYKVGLINLCS